MYQTLLVPLDGSALAEQALPYAEALARRGDARIIVVRAVEDSAVPAAALQTLGEAMRPVARAFVVPEGARRADADDPAEPAHQAEAYLNGVAAQLQERGRIAEPVVAFGKPAAAIVDQVAAQRADLVVMATHGRSGLARVAAGSVAQGVLRAVPDPVLLVRAGTAPPAAPLAGERPRLPLPLDGSGLAEAAIDVAGRLTGQLDAELTLLRVLPEGGTAAADGPRHYLESVADLIAGRYLVSRPLVRLEAGDPAETIGAAARGADLVVIATHGRSGLGRLVYGSVADAVLCGGSAAVLMVRPSALREGRSGTTTSAMDSGLDVGVPGG